jgi:hypothetical protein
MSEIGIGSIESNLFLNLRSGLNASLSGYTNGIFPSYPNPESNDFPGYPISILKTNYNKEPNTFSGNHVFDLNISLITYGLSVQQVSEATQKADNVIWSNETSWGFTIISSNSSDVTPSFIGDNKTIHQKELKVLGRTIQ